MCVCCVFPCHCSIFSNIAFRFSSQDLRKDVDKSIVDRKRVVRDTCACYINFII